MRRLTVTTALVAACLGPAARADDSERLFRDTVQPALETHCYACHSARATKLKGGLRLDTPAALRAGGDSGAVVVPGDAAKSLLVRAVRHDGDLKMPPGKPKLPDAIIADIVKWVEVGAPGLGGDAAADD